MKSKTNKQKTVPSIADLIAKNQSQPENEKLSQNTNDNKPLKVSNTELVKSILMPIIILDTILLLIHQSGEQVRIQDSSHWMIINSIAYHLNWKVKALTYQLIKFSSY